MPYAQKIRKELRAISKRCFCCNKVFAKGEYKADHSGTGLHLILIPGEYPVKYMYQVTDAPPGSIYKAGDVIPVDKFPSFGFRYLADAVCVCYRCHVAIHALALELCRAEDSTFYGNTPFPWLLAEATFNYNLYYDPIPA